MKRNSLESMTYYVNEVVWYFTPINYLLKRMDGPFDCLLFKEERKCLLLAQLPIIFKKYNIRIGSHDLELFLNSNDTVINEIEVDNFLDETEGYTDYQKMQRNFFLEFENYEVINFNASHNCLRGKYYYKENKSIDEFIEEEIKNRYDYELDRSDANMFYNFKIFLQSSVNEEGFIPYKSNIRDEEINTTEELNLKRAIYVERVYE